MIAGTPIPGPLLPLRERWKIMQKLGPDDVIYTEHSVMVGTGRRVEISCPDTAIREIEELVLYGKALLQPVHDAKGNAQFQINTIYVIGDEARLECRDVWILARRIVVMSQRHFAQTVDNVLNFPFLPPSQGRVPCDRFSSSTFVLNIEQGYLHPYRGFDTCIQHGDLPFVQFYLASGEDPNVGLILPLSLAAQHNQPKVVTLLLEVKAHTEAMDQIGTTPLFHAAMHNSVDSAKLLIDAGANIHARNALHQTAVSTAADYGCFEVLNLLATVGADLVNHRPPPDNMPAIILYATGNGSLATLDHLFSRGCSIEVGTVFHDTPINIAAKYGHIGIVAYLLDKKAHLDACGVDGTALENAVKQNHREIVNLLIEADPAAAREFLLNIRPIEAHKMKNFVLSGPLGNMIGQLVLMHAVCIGDYELTKRLVETQMSLQFDDAEGRTLLSQARFSLAMMTAEEPSFPGGRRGIERKKAFDQQKANYIKIIALLTSYGAPEGKQYAVQQPPSQKNKSVQFALEPEILEEMCFVAIEQALTVDDACRAITEVTNWLTSRGYGYSCAEWLAVTRALDNNLFIVANMDVENLHKALEHNDTVNKDLPRQNQRPPQDEKTSG